MGFHQQSDFDEEDDTYAEFDFRTLKFTMEIRMSTSGTLSEDERWGGTHSLTGNVTVPPAYDLTLWENATISIGNYYIKSTGGSITEQSGVSLSPRITVKNGSIIKGYYPTLASALSNAASGETVYMKSSQTLTALCLIFHSAAIHAISMPEPVAMSIRPAFPGATDRWSPAVQAIFPCLPRPCAPCQRSIL